MLCSMAPSLRRRPEHLPVPGHAPAPAALGRKFELDWLRLGIILAVFVFHTTRFFDPEGWHVKNGTVHTWLLVPAAIFTTWAMPLLFVISGAGVSLSLRSRDVARYLRERVLRLPVPPVPGHHYPRRLAGLPGARQPWPVPGVVRRVLPSLLRRAIWLRGKLRISGTPPLVPQRLFVFSLLFLPLFLWCKTRYGRRALDWLSALLARPGGPFLVVVPIALALALPEPGGFWGGRGWGGWNVLGYACFFVAGFLTVSKDELYQSIRRHTVPAMLVIVVGIPLAIFFIGAPAPAHGSLSAWAFLGGFALVAWSTILAILGGAIDGLRAVRTPPFLARATELVLPFYILHQTVILTVGYPVVGWPIPDVIKWAIIALVSLPVTIGLCESGAKVHGAACAVRDEGEGGCIAGVRPYARVSRDRPAVLQERLRSIRRATSRWRTVSVVPLPG